MGRFRVRVSDLRPLRITISLLFLAAAALPFLDIAGMVPAGFSQLLFAFQLVPALSGAIAGIAAAVTGLTFLLLITILFGRVYCSSLCPLGTLQDGISYLSRKLRTTRWYAVQPPRSGLRLSLLVLTALSFVSGGMYVVSLLDPFSNFGRIMAGTARPIITGVYNLGGFLLERAGLYLLYPMTDSAVTIFSVIPPILLVATVAWLAWTRGRLYCNTLCPVGTLLGLISRASLYRITIRGDECTGCGLCARVCKGGCIDDSAKTLDWSRCVSCFNCLTECPTGGISYGRTHADHAAESTDRTRRNIVAGAAVWMVGLAGVPAAAGKKFKGLKASWVPASRFRPVSPPGSSGIRRFTETCTACHLCVTACPTAVLVPSFLDYGVAGILQPRMDYERSVCNFDCTACTEVCPTGALVPLDTPAKRLTQLGAARLIKENCIVFTEETECGACSEHCPTKAVTMIPYKRIMAPEVRNEYCIGCGACEHACPTRPYRAIIVSGLEIHTTATPPPKRQKEKPAPETADFPF